MARLTDWAAYAIRRDQHGAIDIRYYERRARKYRAWWIRMWITEIYSCIVGIWRRRALEAELYALDDRSLRDIGFVRGDIPAIASGAYMRDESRRQRGVRDHDVLEAQDCHADRTTEAQPRVKGEMTMNVQHPLKSREFAESWVEAWNRHDLDAVLAHFSSDFEFSSPFIRQFAGEPSGRLIGKDAVRAYWQAGLSRLPGLHFELVDVLVGVDCLTILYKGHRGLTAEVLTFGVDGRAVRGQAMYAANV